MQRRRVTEVFWPIEALGVAHGLVDGRNGEGESRTRQRSRLELLCERDTRSVPPRYTTIYTGWQP